MKPKQKNTLFYIIIGAVVYVFVFLLALHAGNYVGLHPGASFLEAFGPALNNLSTSPLSVLPIQKGAWTYVGYFSLFYGIICVLIYAENEKNRVTMPGKESGSAVWNTKIKEYNKKYTEPLGKSNSSGGGNIILTQDVQLSMNARKTRRNLNVLVDGGSGSGKSRFYVKPNILQCCFPESKTNLVVTDPKGELASTMGGALEKAGYEIKIFNLIEMQKSCRYNPFNYIRDDLGVLTMINCLITNTNPPGSTSSDPFWEKSETALLQALCFFLLHYRPKEEQNFTNVMKLIRQAEVDENNPNKKSSLDQIFDEVERRDPDSIALKQYKTFKMGAGRTLKGILISASVRLTVFNLKQIENLTSVDDIDLDSLGSVAVNPETGKKEFVKDKKVALFVIIPAADATYNFLVSMMYSQLFETLYHNCETINPNAFTPCPRHIRFLLDEFVNIGQIPDFTKKLATMRQYEISCNIIIQNLAQLKTMYKDDYETIIGNCDSFLFLGGSEYTTLEYISKELGDATIISRDNSRSRGRSGSSTLSYKRQSRKLLLPEEVGKIPDSDCVLLIRGMNPFYGKKYDYPNHPNYKMTGDFNDDNLYYNPYNNFTSEPSEKLEAGYAAERAEKLKNARENPTVQNKVFSDMKSLKGAANTFGYTKNNVTARLKPLLSGDEATTAADTGYAPELELTNFDSGFVASKMPVDVDIPFIEETEAVVSDVPREAKSRSSMENMFKDRENETEDRMFRDV